jgi:hypothetical protein
VVLADAQELAAQHAETFTAPTKEDCRTVKFGDAIKVCVANQERFWVIVLAVMGDKFIGRVDNELTKTSLGVKLNDRIEFTWKNVFDIQKMEEESQQQVGVRPIDPRRGNWNGGGNSAAST